MRICDTLRKIISVGKEGIILLDFFFLLYGKLNINSSAQTYDIIKGLVSALIKWNENQI